MTIFLTVLHVLACLFLIVIVLLQRGKGAEMGAVFGGGAGATVFGSRGAGNFLTRMTTAAAVIFMLTSLTLAYVAEDRSGDSLFEAEEREAAAPESPFGEAPAPAPGAFEEVPAASPEAGAPALSPEAAAPAAEPAPPPSEPEAPAAP
jgi:preprotein translocase subunit SecG